MTWYVQFRARNNEKWWNQPGPVQTEREADFMCRDLLEIDSIEEVRKIKSHDPARARWRCTGKLKKSG